MDKKYKPYQGIYDSVEYCQKEMRLARKLFSNKFTKEEQYEAMLKGLGILSLYCPKEMKVQAEAMIHEAIRRKVYFLSLWGYFE